MSDCSVTARFAESAQCEENLMAPGQEAMGAGVIALECQSPFKKGHGLRRVCRHRQDDVRKCAQNEIIGIQIFWPFPFDALDLRFTQARFDRTDDVQGDFVLECENVVERTVISFGPYMNAGFWPRPIGR